MSEKTIADYSADPVNPWNTWLLENTNPAHRKLHLRVQNIQKTAVRHNWPARAEMAHLDSVIAESGVNVPAFLDEWVAYEEFKVALDEFRLGKAAA